MNKKIYTGVGETVYSYVCDSGLKVTVIPKTGFNKTYALFATNFGSVDSHFIVNGKDVQIPNGVAHFLEHKMFEQKDGSDAFAEFSKYGARANAFTSFDMTAYLFSASDNFEACLRHLLSFVSSPYFTDANVAKEQGIIAQEIKMYDDDPSWTVFFNMLRSLYVEHPIKIDIAGSVESISNITKEILYECYNAYYNPKNMMLCVVGNAEPESVFDIADQIVQKTEYEVGNTVFPKEGEGIAAPLRKQKMDVSLPLFSIGFKEKVYENQYDYDALYSVVLEIMFGKSSKLYNDLYTKGLVTSLSYSYNFGKRYAFTEISGESPDPETVYSAILKCIEKFKKDGFSQNQIDIAKKTLYGRYIKGCNAPENIAQRYVGAAFLGGNFMTYGEKILAVDKKGADSLLKNGMSISTLSVVNGGQNK